MASSGPQLSTIIKQADAKAKSGMLTAQEAKDHLEACKRFLANMKTELGPDRLVPENVPSGSALVTAATVFAQYFDGKYSQRVQTLGKIIEGERSLADYASHVLACNSLFENANNPRQIKPSGQSSPQHTLPRKPLPRLQIERPQPISGQAYHKPWMTREQMVSSVAQARSEYRTAKNEVKNLATADAYYEKCKMKALRKYAEEEVRFGPHFPGQDP